MPPLCYNCAIAAASRYVCPNLTPRHMISIPGHSAKKDMLSINYPRATTAPPLAVNPQCYDLAMLLLGYQSATVIYQISNRGRRNAALCIWTVTNYQCATNNNQRYRYAIINMLGPVVCHQCATNARPAPSYQCVIRYAPPIY